MFDFYCSYLFNIHKLNSIFLIFLLNIQDSIFAYRFSRSCPIHHMEWYSEFLSRKSWHSRPHVCFGTKPWWKWFDQDLWISAVLKRTITYIGPLNLWNAVHIAILILSIYHIHLVGSNILGNCIKETIITYKEIFS